LKKLFEETSGNNYFKSVTSNTGVGMQNDLNSKHLVHFITGYVVT